MAKKGIIKRDKKGYRFKGKNYLLAIAIDKYLHFEKLNNAVKDAKEFVNTLNEKFQFESSFTTEVYNENATRAEIYNNFRNLNKKVISEDNLIIYFSGHGDRSNIFDHGYWIPYEANQGAIHEYISNAEIKVFLDAIPSHHIFIIVDSCFSGSLFFDVTKGRENKRYEEDPSRWGLASGRMEIVSDGKAGNNSPFAHNLINFLKEATQALSVQEICTFVTESVGTQFNQTPIGAPLNVKGHLNGQFVFHLKKDEIADWEETKVINTEERYKLFLEKYPNGKNWKKASIRLYTLIISKIMNLENDTLEESWEYAASKLNVFKYEHKEFLSKHDTKGELAMLIKVNLKECHKKIASFIIPENVLKENITRTNTVFRDI